MKRLLVLGVALALGCTAAAAQTMTKLKAGMVSGFDQIGLPIALERGFFEKRGLDVTIARPYATGVDALNALQAGESEIVQVGVPMIGAVLRGMDLVALGNYSGNATKAGSDATMADHRPRGFRHRQGQPRQPEGQEDRGFLRHHQSSLHPGHSRKGRAEAGGRDAGEYAAAGHDGRAARQGHRRLLGMGSLADRGEQGRAGRDRDHPRRRRDLLSRLQRGACVPGSRRTARPSRNSSPPSRKPTSGCARIRNRPPRSRPAGFPA